ncbi:hypothetical protein BDZ45DRAFT_700011 [Acephala macrosclerotiorum]|nr:hypothetical protein BDZ45DRAFT_700011 [Acephala macrosclerotiorum]
MSFSNSRFSTNFVLPNFATQTPPNLDEHWILNWTYNMQAAPDIAARRVTAFDFIRKGFVKVNGTNYSIAQLIRFAQGGPPSANLEQGRAVSVDDDSDVESLTAMALDGRLSRRYAQLPAIPTDRGSENDDKRRMEEKNSRGVGLALDTTGFYSVDTTEAVPSAKHLDTFCDTQTNDNFGVAEADDSLVNRQTSEAFNKTPPKLNKQKAAQSKTSSNESRKRVQLGAPKNPVIDLVSDSEGEVEVMPDTQHNSLQDSVNQTDDEVEVMSDTQHNSLQDSVNETDDEVERRHQPNKRPRPTKNSTASHLQPDSVQDSADETNDEVERRQQPNKRPRPTKKATATHFQSDSLQDSASETDDEVEHRQKSNKRPRPTKEATATHAQLNSSKGSGKARDDGSKGRRKSNTRTKLTTREFKDHIDTEATWLSAASTRCNVLRKLFKNQKECIAALDDLEAEHCQIVAKLSADCLPRHARLQLTAELEDVEERRGDVTIELRRAMNLICREGAAMKQGLEQWSVTEQKVTERIERSR